MSAAVIDAPGLPMRQRGTEDASTSTTGTTWSTSGWSSRTARSATVRQRARPRRVDRGSHEPVGGDDPDACVTGRGAVHEHLRQAGQRGVELPGADTGRRLGEHGVRAWWRAPRDPLDDPVDGPEERAHPRRADGGRSERQQDLRPSARSSPIRAPATMRVATNTRTPPRRPVGRATRPPAGTSPRPPGPHVLRPCYDGSDRRGWRGSRR